MGMKIGINNLEARAIAIAYSERQEGYMKTLLESVCKKLYESGMKEDKTFYEHFTHKKTHESKKTRILRAFHTVCQVLDNNDELHEFLSSLSSDQKEVLYEKQAVKDFEFLP